MVNETQQKIFNKTIEESSCSPLTGFFRTGCCESDESDIGMHTVCVIVNEDFLLFSKAVGNDLSTPIPEYRFEGLKDGDKWCLCALRWKEALINNIAPKVVLEATNEKTLKVVSFEDLLKHSHKV